MVMKAHLARTSDGVEVVRSLNARLKDLESITKNPRTKEDVSRIRQHVESFYSGLTKAELYRVRTTYLNILRRMLIPVSTLISDDVQLESGHTIPLRQGRTGRQLGDVVYFRKNGQIARTSRILIAGSDFSEDDSKDLKF
jgi:hypothetical protein